ncbi:PLP-dependent aminotransferase family protein [Rhizobium calliandrae]|uniref:PLP-dependent aminotransferase family protein n=1 Tax=Rhizobium calliandrae TaxID=1312182 RepID=A0ABT7KSA8_9HYPH|nr:PLP-dependent aminotransferase family protein [Rhizobium calliandrae]MDL2410344.1 PLP-dependent aminotransferase family protein [Rhizobium calliandrae]
MNEVKEIGTNFIVGTAQAAIDFGRNFPPPSPLVATYLNSALEELTSFDSASAIRFPRFTGTDRDRAAGAALLARRLGAPPSIDKIVMANGSQSIVGMLMGTLIGPGGMLLTEALTYPAIKPLASLFGIGLRPVEIDEEGLLPDELEKACSELGDRACALYCMPTFHNPTSATMSPKRRTEIAAVARRRDVWIIEDDIYGMLPAAAPPPLSTFAPERTWYMFGLSKSLAAQLRVAYVVAPDSTTAQRVFWPSIKTTNWMVAPLVAEVATRWIENGAANAILKSVRGEIDLRQVIVREELAPWAVRVPRFCYHVWLQLSEAWSAGRFADEVRSRGVAVGTGESFSVIPGEYQKMIRIGIGVPPNQGTLRDGLKILKETYDRMP